MHPNVHGSTVYNSQDMETTQVFTDRWMDKEGVVYIHNGLLLSPKKNNEIMPFAATWMDLEIIILSEVRERKILYDITYMWNLKNNTSEIIYKRETDVENNLMVTKGEGGVG